MYDIVFDNEVNQIGKTAKQYSNMYLDGDIFAKLMHSF